MAEWINGEEYIGVPCEPEYGKNPDTGKTEAKFSMRVTKGPMAGRKLKYSANFGSAKGVSYARKDLKAAGWKGPSITTLVADLTAAEEANKEIKFTARLAEGKEKSDGTKNTWWTVGRIGGPPPLVKSESAANEIDSLFRDIEEREQDEAAPSGVDEDIPF